MIDSFFKAALSFCGLGAVGAFVFWSIYKNWLALPIFQRMTKSQQFRLFALTLLLTFLLGIASIAAFVTIELKKPRGAELSKKEYITQIQQTHDHNKRTLEDALVSKDVENPGQVKRTLEVLDATVADLEENVTNDKFTASAESRRRYNDSISQIQSSEDTIPDPEKKEQETSGAGGGGGGSFRGLERIMDKFDY